MWNFYVFPKKMFVESIQKEKFDWDLFPFPGNPRPMNFILAGLSSENVTSLHCVDFPPAAGQIGSDIRRFH